MGPKYHTLGGRDRAGALSPGPKTGFEVERPPTTEDQRTTPLDDDRTVAMEGETRRRFAAARDETEALDRPIGPPAGRDPLVLDRYRLERRLGAGGFGVVWLAFDEKLEREVAVKIVERDGGGPVPERAVREARVAARLNHPGIVSLYELGEDEHSVYLVSELVHGRTMADLTRAGALADRDVARIGTALCDALAHAHDRKVIHRDVKPQNVLVAAEPAAGEGFAKLADFGVAYLGAADPLTRTGDVVGTLAYMAPEQAEGARVTTAADVYALALTLYEAWTGTNPVRGPSPAATARRLGRPLPSMASYRRDLPPDLCAWIDAALDPIPDRRPKLRDLRRGIADAAPALGESGGLREPETRMRVGIAPTTGRRGPVLTGGRLEDVATRAGAGLAAGGLVLAGLATLGPDPHFSAAAAALGVALAVGVLPRVAWLLAAIGFVAWLGWHLRDGTALVVGVALVAPPLLAPRAGRAWSLPALAPLLGVVALAPLYAAVAGFASTAARRAGLGAAGFVWLVFAELLTSDRLVFGPPADAAARAAWSGSISAAGTDALAPLATSAVLLGAAVWALAAVLLPLLVRGGSLAIDAAGATLWAVLLVAAHRGVAELAAGDIHGAGPRGAVAGAIVGALAAVAARASGLWWSPGKPGPLP
ncbi:MAG: eukaryotic-like serine/threonine-protein kinase [Thermoleophilaceae bacterium]|nr:eukaryotic-like serine/threonine-protein kinase [Thermoleophilaceae bacterium]